MSDWRDAYLEGCLPSEVPWDAYPEERVTVAERLGEYPGQRPAAVLEQTEDEQEAA